MTLKNIEAIAKIAAFMSAAAIGLVGLGVIETVKLNKQLKKWAHAQGELAPSLEESIETDKMLLKYIEEEIKPLKPKTIGEDIL